MSILDDIHAAVWQVRVYGVDPLGQVAVNLTFEDWAELYHALRDRQDAPTVLESDLSAERPVAARLFDAVIYKGAYESAVWFENEEPGARRWLLADLVRLAREVPRA